MSDPQVQPPEPDEVPAAGEGSGAGTGCPITDEFLPPNMRKHVDVKAPVPLRMMAAKTLVPLSPSDMIGALFMLSYDPDPGVRETAAKTAQTLPDRILATALRDEGLKPPVLGYYLRLYAHKDTYAELLILNPTTPDDAVAASAKACSQQIAETIGQNQLRILRHDDIIRELVQNPNASPALIDSVCDFAVRNGLLLMDVPPMKAARIRLFGPEAAAKPPDPGPTAEEVIAEYEGLGTDAASPLEEVTRMTVSQKIMKMSVSEKIKLATLGNKEARSLLIRDTNRLVSVAVIRSPRITDGEVDAIANNRAALDDVLRVVWGNREWTKRYTVKVALVKNPKTPMAIAMKFMSTLRESEIKDLARNKNVPSGIQMHAKKMMEKKNAPKKEK